jgi:hypothetical protein
MGLPDLELLAVGRISVDHYASEPGGGWSDAHGFSKGVGGGPTRARGSGRARRHQGVGAHRVQFWEER